MDTWNFEDRHTTPQLQQLWCQHWVLLLHPAGLLGMPQTSAAAACCVPITDGFWPKVIFQQLHQLSSAEGRTCQSEVLQLLLVWQPWELTLAQRTVQKMCCSRAERRIRAALLLLLLPPLPLAAAIATRSSSASRFLYHADARADGRAAILLLLMAA